MTQPTLVRRVPRRGLLRAAACLVLALVAAVPAPAAAAPATTSAKTTHWSLVSEGPQSETDELARVLDLAWPQFEAFFGAAPKLATDETLPVRLFESADAMKDAIRKGGGAAPDSGGYYCPVARTSYAFRQPSRWYTRTLVLHEAAHQFHLRGVAARPKGPHPSWWLEGLVEHVSHHTWDGTTLRTGVVPPISLEDRSGAVLAAVEADRAWSPEKVAADPLDRPKAMHVVKWMLEGAQGRPIPKWKDAQKRLDGGDAPKPRELAAILGGGDLRSKFAAWLPSVQQPLLSCFVEWDSTGADSVRGSGAAVVACRTRGAAREVSADVTVLEPSKPWRAGLLLHWGGGDDYVIFQMESGTSFFADARRDGKWTRLASGTLPEGGPERSLSAVRDGSDVVVSLAGTELARVAVPSATGPLGFCLEGCTADFRRLKFR